MTVTKDVQPAATPYDVPAIMAGLYGDGIIGLKGAFSREWVARLGQELPVLYQQALARPGGAVGRGTNRHYVEIHPEDISGFLDLVTHPWVRAVCESVLGLTCSLKTSPDVNGGSDIMTGSIPGGQHEGKEAHRGADRIRAQTG